MNNLNCNKTFTLLEDHYFQEKVELFFQILDFQTLFIVYKVNTIYTGTFTFMPVDKTWLYDPLKILHNCPAHHPFDV